MLRNLIDLLSKKKSLRKQSRASRREAFQREMMRRLRLESLEQRVVLAAFTWTGATDTDFGTPANWNVVGTDADGIPDADDAVTINNQANDPVLDMNRAIGSLSGADGILDLATFTLTAGQDNSSTTYDGVMTGAGGFTKQGTGTMTLGGANSYGGATNIANGALRLGSAGVLPDASEVTIAAIGTLDLNGNSETIGPLNGAAGAIVTSGLPGLVTLSADGNGVVFSGVIQDGAGTLTFNKVGGGTLPIAGVNTYSGATDVNAGELRLQTFNLLPDASPLSVAAGAAFNNNGNNETVGSLAGAGNVLFASGAALRVGGNNANTVFSGAITGTGSLVKEGTGEMEISGTGNSWVGGLNLSEGEVIVTGTVGSNVNVSNPVAFPTLRGTGTITQVTNVGAGQVAPGVSGPGTLTISGQPQFNTSTTFEVELNGSGPGQFDRIVSALQPSLGGATLAVTLGFVPSSTDSFMIMDNQSGNLVSGTFAGLPEGATFTVGTTTFQITYQGGTGNDVVLNPFGSTSVQLSGGNLLITDAAGGNTNDDLTLAAVGANLRVSDPTNTLLAHPGTTQVDPHTVDVPLISIMGNVQVNLLAGDDSLTVDFGGGNPVPPGGINYDAGTQATATGDLLRILGTFTTQTLTYTTTGPDGNNGNVDLDGSLITYTGLEPIFAGNAADTILNLPVAAANDATLRDSANAGEIEIIDNGATFEDTVIPNPTNSLMVNLGNQGDRLQVNTLDAAYAASMIIRGGTGTDDVDFSSVNISGTPGRGLEVSAVETLDITGSVFNDNTADRGGGLLVMGGTVTIDSSEFSGNVATGNLATDGGGGIYNDGAEMTIRNNSLILGNTATGTAGSGGGIFNHNGGSLTVMDSTIFINQANRAGGGIETTNGTTVTLTNVTLDVNNAGVVPATPAPGNGGGLHVSGNATVNITGGSVSGNFAANEGGGLWNGSGTMTVSGTTIDTNQALGGAAADDGGGGIFNNGGTLIVQNGTSITNNTASTISGMGLSSGGGILSIGAGTVTVTDSTVSGNTALRAGGGIEIGLGAGLTTLTNVMLNNNVAQGGGASSPGNGGGLHITGAGNVNVTGGTVNSNDAALEGGGLWNGSGTMTVSGTMIDDNQAFGGAAADDGGGGIFNNGGTLIVQNNTAITNNTASTNSGTGLSSGGGILSIGAGTVTVTDSTVSDNTALRAGGGIEIGSGAGLTTLTNVTLNNNVAQGGGASSPGNGGGLHITGAGNVNIAGGEVNQNTAALEGGGLWNAGGTMTIQGGTVISSNTAQGGAAADDGGGGIFNNGGTVNVLPGTQITGNQATGALGSGGGILNLGGTVTVTLSTIDNNFARRAGGGIEDNGGTLVDVVDSSIYFNQTGSAPGNGGGVHITGAGNVQLDGSTVAFNAADNEGGGLWNSGSGTLTLTNSTISNNVATTDGGGIFNTSGGSTNLDSVTIAENTAGNNGGGIAGGTGGVDLRNTIVATNNAPTGPDISGTVNSSDFNLIGDDSDATFTGFVGNTIFNADPLLLPLAFNGGPTQTHLPSAGSPAINNGDTMLAVDQRDVSRPQGENDDIGAVEVDLNGFVISADDLALGQAGDGNPDEFLVRRSAPGVLADIQVFINSVLVFSQPAATTGSIVIQGSVDDDTLVVDNANDLVGTALYFAADGGFDRLRLIGSTPTTTTYNPGFGLGSGAVFQENDNVIQRVQFEGLEPVEVRGTGAGDTLILADSLLITGFPQALNADNAITYIQGPNNALEGHPVFDPDGIGGNPADTTGLISVDGFETIEFSNFGTLEINAGSGNDLILANTPVAPTALDQITLAGDNGQDSVVVNGTAGDDAINVASTAIDAADLTGVQGVTMVSVVSTETLAVDGLGGTDSLDVPTENAIITPAAQPGSGHIAPQTAAGNALLAVSYVNTETVVVTGTRAVVRGSEDSDVFQVSDAGEVSLLNALNGANTVDVSGFGELVLDGRGGDNFFSIAVESQAFFSNIDVLGGAGNDLLTVVGDIDDDDIYTLSLFEPGFGLVEVNFQLLINYGAIEEIDFDDSLFGPGVPPDADQLVILGGLGDNHWTVGSGDVADLVQIDQREAINYLGFEDVQLLNRFGTDTFEIHPAFLSGFSNELIISGSETDVVEIIGTEAVDTITSDANTVFFGNGGFVTPITVDSLFPIAELRLSTLGGDDDILLGLALLGTRKVVDAGYGNDTVDLSAMFDAVIFGGAGDDVLIGTPVADVIHGGDGDDTIDGQAGGDLIFGDSGDDILVGGDDSDTIYGGDGNDQFGEPATRDTAPNDRGNDFFDGGAGSDSFFWDPGDGDDRIEGGAGDSDQIFFFGSGGGETFNLFADSLSPSRFHLFRSLGAIDIDAADVEEVNLETQGGDDTVFVGRDLNGVVADLTTTSLRSVDVDLNDDGLADNVVFEGRALDDNLLVSTADGTVKVDGLSYDLRVSGADAALDRLTVSGNEGHDTIQAEPGVEDVILITLEGGAGNDFLSADAILNGGDGHDTLIGGAGDDAIDGGAGDDLIDGRGGTNTIDGGTGTDTILVSGTAGDNAITTTHAGGLFSVADGSADPSPSVGDNDITNIEAVRIEAGAGSDTITLNMDAGLNYYVSGGDPIGPVGDALILNPPVAPVFTPGPEGDSGGFEVGGDLVSFDEIEAIDIDLAASGGAATIMGSGGNDSITAVGVAPGTVDVQVNDGPILRYSGSTSLTLQGKNGDDDFTLDVNVAGLGVAFVIDGGLPTAGSDQLRLTGVNGVDDLPMFLPTDADAATVTLVGQSPVNIVGVEHFIYDGESDNETLTFLGDGLGAGTLDNFVHVPGEFPDSGLGYDYPVNFPQTLLPLNYENLGDFGVVTYDGQDGLDLLTFLATTFSDRLEVSFTGIDEATFDLLSGRGFYNQIATSSVELYELDGGQTGFDDIYLNTPVTVTVDPVSGDAFKIFGGGPADTLHLTADGTTTAVAITPMPGFVNSQIITGFGTVAVEAGYMNAIFYQGNGADTLTIDPGDGDNTVRVERGSAGGDRVTSSGMPPIDFSDVSTLVVDASGQGSDVVTFKTWFLQGAAATNYQMVGNVVDTLVIEGSDAADDVYTVTHPGGNLSVADGNGLGVVVTETSGALGRLVVNTLGGSDTINVTPSSTTEIFVEGGDPIGVLGDTLNLLPAEAPTFTPGPLGDQGGFSFATDASVSFEHIENVTVDLAGVGGVATIMGTQDDDHITATGTALGVVEVTVNDGPVVTYTNATALTLQGKNGDDDLVIDAALAGAGVIFTVEGGSSTNGSDTLSVLSVAGLDILTVTPGGQGFGQVSHSGAAGTVFYSGIEDIELIGQLADGDSFAVGGTAGVDLFEYFSGLTIDTGTILGAMGNASFSLPEIRFSGMSPIVPRTFGASTGDAFAFFGTNSSDGVTFAGSLLTNSLSGVPAATIDVGLPSLMLIETEDGEDTITVTPRAGLAIQVDGDGPGSSGDVLNFFSTGGQVTANLSTSTITEAGLGPVVYSGIERVNIDAGGNTGINFDTGADDDDVTVTVLSATSGRVEANTVTPVVYYSNTGANNQIDFSLNGGQDRLTVVGNALPQTFDVNASGAVNADGDAPFSVAIDDGNDATNDGFVTWVTNDIEALSVHGLEGNDHFDVTPGEIPVLIDGGDPIGAVGDTLRVLATAGVMFTPGPEADEGGFSFTAEQPVSYDKIEAATVDLGGANGAAVIMGTGDSDEITAVGVAANTVEVQVNDGPIVTYTNATALTLQGKNGDDNITIDIAGPGIAGAFALGVVFNVEGGLPTAGSDALRVTGVDGLPDNPNWQPTGEGAGVLQLVTQAPINVIGVEQLIYDGESDNDALVVSGTAAADQFTHRPGAAVDAGSVGVHSAGSELLGIHYENLGGAGSVTIDGLAGDDSLTALGTSASDTMAVAFSALDAIDIDLTSAAGTHVDLLSTAVENYVLDTLEGDDDVNLTATINASGTFSVRGGGPGLGSDTLRITATDGAGPQSIAIIPDAANPDDQDITGLGAVVNATGIELIRFIGSGGDDTLTVNPGNGDNTVRVASAHPGPWDSVTSDSLPQVDFLGMNSFIVDAGGQGSDVVTFKTWFLQGAVNTNYQMVGGLTDTLVIEGSDGADDSFTVNDLGASAVAIRDNNALGGAGVTVSELSGGLGRVQINTLGGTDLVTVASIPGVDLSVDGGDPTSGDRLDVVAAGNARVTQAAVSTSGLIDQTGAGSIDYANAERLDLASATAGSTLTVRGTDDNDTITVADLGTNLVWINDGTIISFGDAFSNLDVQGRFGTDAFEITPIDNVAINVQGMSPTAGENVVVNGTAAADAITVDNITADGARVTVGGLQPVTLQTIEHLQLVGRGGGDNLTIVGSTGADRFEHRPGAAVDAGHVALADTTRTLLGTSYEDLGAAGTVTVNGNGGADTLVALGSGASDTMDVAFTGSNAIDLDLTTPAGVHVDLLSIAVQSYHVEMLEGDDTVNVQGPVNVTTGGSLTVVGGGNGEGSDALNYTGAGGNLALDLQAGSIVEAGNPPLLYSGIEHVDLNASGASLSVAGTDEDEDLTITLFNGTSGKIERGLAVQQNGQVQSPIQPPLVTYANISATSAVTFDLRGGDDTLVIVGSANPQTFDVNVTTSAVTVDDFSDSGIDGRVAWTNLESLEAFGLEGNDTFNVTPGSIPVFIDGGDPIGQTAGDRINILQPDPANPTAVVFEPGPEDDEGGFIVGGHARVSFDHIEALGAIGAGKAIIVGTNGDDDITIIARTELSDPDQFVGADGVQDFTTSVNGGAEILWIDTPLVFVDGLSGDDDITVRTPAPPVPGPNPAVWNVDVYVAGGTPSAPATGDRLRVETPYASNDITYQPTSPDSGIMSILNAGGATQSTIYIGAWEVDCDGDPQTTDDIFRSSPGGVEHLIYDGVSSEGGFTLNDPNNPPPTQNPATAFTDNITVLGDGFAQAASDDRFVHTPGSTADAGRVDIADTTNNQTMLALQYNNIGLDATVTTDGLTGNDTLVALGTASSDVVDAEFTGLDAIDIDLHSAAGTHVDLLSASVENYAIDTLDGDDIVNVTAPITTSTLGSFAVHGGSPGSGSDVLNLLGAAAAIETVTITPDANDSQQQDITGLGTRIDAQGFELISYTGNNGGTPDDTFIVNPGAGDNVMRVERGDNVNRVTSDSLPEIEFIGHARFVADVSEAGSDVVTFKTWFLGAATEVAYDILGNATDTLVIEGADGAGFGSDSYTVTNPANVPTIGDPQVAVRDNRGNQITVRSFGTGRVQINTLGGDDLVTVDVSVANGSDLISVPIEFDGGSGSDTLRVEGAPATGTTAATYSPGPDVTAGRLRHIGGETTMTIDFANLEPVIDLVPGTLTVNGTHADNAITYAESDVNAAWDQVSVDAFESIHFANKTDLMINGLGGSDAISLNNAASPSASLTTINVNGGDPTSSGDSVVVNGTTGQDTVNVTPTGIGAATVTGLGPAINVSTSESLVYNGRGGNDLLTVMGTANADQFVHQPGDAVDAGSMSFRSGGNSWLTTHYQHLGVDGTVTAVGGGGSDSLSALGTGGSDTLDVRFGGSDAIDLDLTSALGVHVDLLSSQVENYLVETLEGDDDVNLFAPVAASGTFRVVGGGPGGDTDRLDLIGALNAPEDVVIAPDANASDEQEISGLGATIDAKGYELITYTGADDDDSLTVQLGPGDNTARVERGPSLGGLPADLVTSDSLPGVQFAALSAFTVDAQLGADMVTFKTWFLAGAGAYRFTGIGTDTLVIEGNEALADDFDVTSPAESQLAVTDNRGTNATVTTTPGGLPGTLLINTLGGNDLVELDGISLTATDPTSIIVDGGAGDDTIDAGTNAGVGKAGTTDDDVRLTLIGGAGNDSLIGGESPTGSAPGDFLFGGDGDDRLEGGRGQDQFFGGAGSDLLVWVAGDGSDLMEGGAGDSDQMLFVGSGGANRMELFGGGSFGATSNPAPNIFVPGTLLNASRAIFALASSSVDVAAVFLNMSDVENIRVDALSGADEMTINNQVDTTSVTGGFIQAGTDLSVTHVKSVLVDLGTDDDATDNVNVHGRLVADNINITTQDTDASGSADRVDVAGLPFSVSITGSAAVINGTTVDPSSDRLTVDGNSGDDTIKAAVGVENLIAITLNGDAGDDFLSADAILNGGAGDDFLEGGALDDVINGGAGEDTMVGGTGNDTFDGGADFDTILIEATSGNDHIDVDQPNATTLRYAIGGVIGVAPTETDTLVSGTVEEARIEAKAGDDVIRVTPSEALIVASMENLSLRFTVIGGAPLASDRLAVVDDGLGDTVIHRLGADDRSGSMSVGALAPVVYEQVEYAQVVPQDAITSGTGDDGEGRIVVFKHDPFESNNSLPNATFLGSGATINVDPTIDPGADEVFQNLPGDDDWYRFVAASTGTLDFQVYFRQIGTLANGRAGLPGDGNLNIDVYDAAGNLISGFGVNDATSDERRRIPAVQGQTYYLRVHGATGPAINNYTMTILNEAPPAPYDLELQDTPVGDPPPANSDTGRSNFDDITRDNTPTLFFRLDDGIFRFDVQGNDPGTGGFPNNPPNGVAIPIPFQTTQTPGFRIAMFDEGPTPSQPATNPQIPVGFATAVAGSPGLYTFTYPILSDGSHFLSARVQMVDPSNPLQTGFGERSVSLEIIVDTVFPPVSFGQPGNPDDGLKPDSDSGVSPPNPDTIADRITNDTTPTFWGRGEADAIIRLYADVNGNGVLDLATDVFLGQDTAIPLDGNQQEPDGYWEIESVVDLNDPDFFPDMDGLRTIFVTAEDVAGNVNNGPNAAETFEIFIDTQGPRIDEVFVTSAPGYDLFDPKPSEDGPSPLVRSLTIKFTDPPDRVAPDFLFPALKRDVAENPGHYLLVGDANGIIPIESVIVTDLPREDGMPAMATVRLVFVKPLPDDRFTLTVSDSISDLAGNALDGESNAIEPQENPLFPTGDGVPGGDFVARFTIDSRPEVGVWAAGSVWIDTNGNTIFDPTNLDFTNRDIVYAFGNGGPAAAINAGGQQAFTSDDFFAGNFRHPGNDGILGTADDGPADGFDKLAVYGSLGQGINGPWRFLIDGDNDGAPDGSFAQTTSGFTNQQLNGLPVAGNFDGVTANGDEVGIFTGTAWYLDTNGDFLLDTQIQNQLRGYPIVGDFDGDGLEDLGTWHNEGVNSGQFQFDLAFNGFGPVDAVINFGFIGVRERPVAADMDQDGIDDVGLWTPDRAGVTPDERAEWYFLISNDPTGERRITGQVNTLQHPFEPVPFGADLYMQFGSEFALPILGNFDPPVSSSSGSGGGTGGGLPGDGASFHPYDVNRDGFISAVDVLQLVNRMNLEGSHPLGLTQEDSRHDPNRDQYLSPVDALLVINHLIGASGAGAEGEGPSSGSVLIASDSLVTTDLVGSGQLELAASAQLALSKLDAGATSLAGRTSGRSGSDRESADRESTALAADRWFNQLGDTDRVTHEDVDGTALVLDQLLGGDDVDLETLDALLATLFDEEKVD